MGLVACQSCHNFEFYSLALKAAQAKGLTWTDENLMAYMADPKAFLNEFNGQELRSAMSFQLKDEAKRKAAIDGLKIIAALALQSRPLRVRRAPGPP